MKIVNSGCVVSGLIESSPRLLAATLRACTWRTSPGYRQRKRGFPLPPKRASIEISHSRRRLPRGQTISKIVPITKADFLQPPRYHVGRLVKLTHSGAIDAGLEAEHRKHLETESYKS